VAVVVASLTAFDGDSCAADAGIGAYVNSRAIPVDVPISHPRRTRFTACAPMVGTVTGQDGGAATGE